MTKKAQEEQAAETRVATRNDVPEYIKQGGARGSEAVEQEDLIIPRLEIIQSLSPARKKDKPEYIEGAEEGMLFNTVTRELYGTEVFIVPVMFLKEYLLWINRDAGGGFRGAFKTREEAARRSAEVSEAHEIVDTAEHLCLLINGDSVEEVMISMSRSKMKVSRNFNSLVRILKGDRFSHVYKVITVLEKNQRGEFFNFKISEVGVPSREIYLLAEQLYEDVASGTKKVQADRSEEERGGDTTAGAVAEDRF